MGGIVSAGLGLAGSIVGAAKGGGGEAGEAKESKKEKKAEKKKQEQMQMMQMMQQQQQMRQQQQMMGLIQEAIKSAKGGQAPAPQGAGGPF